MSHEFVDMMVVKHFGALLQYPKKWIQGKSLLYCQWAVVPIHWWLEWWIKECAGTASMHFSDSRVAFTCKNHQLTSLISYPKAIEKNHTEKIWSDTIEWWKGLVGKWKVRKGKLLHLVAFCVFFFHFPFPTPLSPSANKALMSYGRKMGHGWC